MNKTPRSDRLHIGIYGKTNAGKSSILNKIFKKEVSIVSSVEGTTTDPVFKNIELDSLGPTTFIDTGGYVDRSILGEKRISKTNNTIEQIDIGIYVMNVIDLDIEPYLIFKEKLKKRNTPSLLIINKIDLVDKENLDKIKKDFIEYKPIFISTLTDSMDKIIDNIKEKVEIIDNSILQGLVEEKDHILLVISIDSEYPKGRLILPQAQVIRDGLRNNLFISTVKDTELKAFLKKYKDIKLVITDSKIFKEVADIVPENIALTSFSILMANYKGDLNIFLKGIKKLEKLKNQKGNKILIYESCNHTSNHEDIGTVKIPNMLHEYFKYRPKIDFAQGKGIENFKDYDLIIHCGACMENKKHVVNKLRQCEDNNVGIVNYGTLFAFFSDILDRSVDIFN